MAKSGVKVIEQIAPVGDTVPSSGSPAITVSDISIRTVAGIQSPETLGIRLPARQRGRGNIVDESSSHS